MSPHNLNQPAWAVHLAKQHVVDLPLNAQQIIDLETQADWGKSGGALTLSRRHWWHNRTDWATPWKTIATAAIVHSPIAFTTITQAALTGAIADASAGQTTHRYLLIVVSALEAAHSIGASPAPDYLAQVASRANEDIVPSLKIIYQAVRQALAQRGDPDATSTAATLLAVNINDPELWT